MSQFEHEDETHSPALNKLIRELQAGGFGPRHAVDHPAHYGGDTTYEVIKVIEAWELGFCLGNAVKYIARAGKKHPERTVEDLEKARWYIDRELKSLARAANTASTPVSPEMADPTEVPQVKPENLP
jgi:hypothetical protein